MTSSPIIDLDAWKVEETNLSVMVSSNKKNCAIKNSVTNSITEIKTPVFQTKYGIDDGFNSLKIKINLGEIPFDKFQEFDEFIKNYDKSTIFEKKRKDPLYCPLISNESFMNFHIKIDKLIVIDKKNKIIKPLDIDLLKSLVPGKSNIICFIKFDYLYNNNGRYGVMKYVTKIQIVE